MPVKLLSYLYPMAYHTVHTSLIVSPSSFPTPSSTHSIWLPFVLSVTATSCLFLSAYHLVSVWWLLRLPLIPCSYHGVRDDYSLFLSSLGDLPSTLGRLSATVASFQLLLSFSFAAVAPSSQLMAAATIGCCRCIGRPSIHIDTLMHVQITRNLRANQQQNERAIECSENACICM